MLKRFEKFIYDITEIDLYWHRIASAEMKRFGLKGNYAVYFTALNRRSDGMTAAEITVEVGKDKADVSRDINALESAGFLTRSPRNAYRAKITLTDKGRELSAIIIRKAEQAVEQTGSGLTDEQRNTFYYALDLITENLKKLCETGLADTDEPPEL